MFLFMQVMSSKNNWGKNYLLNDDDNNTCSTLLLEKDSFLAWTNSRESLFAEQKTHLLDVL